ncbi:MAG: outer membrane protein-like protein [Bacteroidota bacterium]|nr:outer membrane protein-like protein [Bacteroidota bacterium]
MKSPIRTILSIAFLSAMVFTACNQNNPVKEADDANKQNSDSSATKPANAVSTEDAEFATKAANAGMMEVKLGEIAGQKSKNAKVKDFGAMMVTDHTKAGNELKAIAANKNLVLPDSLGSGDQKMVDDVAKKNGTAFDKDYVDMMVNDHEKVIDAFKKEANDGKDAELKMFAANTLPVLQKHLASAKETQKSVIKERCKPTNVAQRLIF